MEKRNANSASKLRKLFTDKSSQSMTLKEINQFLPELLPNEISMALCYLRRQRYLTREQIDSNDKMGRKKVYIYTYHSTRLPKETENAIS